MHNHESLASLPTLPQIASTESGLPVANVSGRVSLEAMLRANQQAVHRAACFMALADERERLARDLYDKVIHQLFGAGLLLQATCPLVDASAQTCIETTIDVLDSTITELRTAIFPVH